MPCGVTVLRHTLAYPLQTWDSRGFKWDSLTEGEIRAQEGEELAREFYAKQNVAPDPGSLFSPEPWSSLG